MPEPLETDTRGRIYCTVPYFEAEYGRSHDTIHKWVTTSRIRSMTINRTIYIHLGDARKLDRVTPRQTRRSLHKRAG